MATIITNQATLNYRFGTVNASAVSNITSAVLGGSVEIAKSSLSETYRAGGSITYIIDITNSGSAIENITIMDNLGRYNVGENDYTPLNFSGNAMLFVNGVESEGLTSNVTANGVEFTIAEIPANGNAQIIYQADVNGFAPISCGSTIVNRVSSECECICGGPATASHTVNAECFADVRIFKSVSPNPILCGEALTYSFDIYNYGNIPATDVVLTDTFTPPLTDIVVSADGNVIESREYRYCDGKLTLPKSGSEFEITVPEAVFTRDELTGEYTVTPGHIQIVVTGNI